MFWAQPISRMEVHSGVKSRLRMPASGALADLRKARPELPPLADGRNAMKRSNTVGAGAGSRDLKAISPRDRCNIQNFRACRARHAIASASA
jgi:hypothetical protein